MSPLNSDLSFNYLYGYLIKLSDDKKWIVFKRNGRVRFNGCLSICWNNGFYLQVSVCRENDDSKGTPVPVVGVSITCPLKQDNAFVYVDRVLRVKEGERLCFAFIMPNWCDTTGGFINRNSAGTSSGLMANYVSFNDEKYVWNNNFRVLAKMVGYEELKISYTEIIKLCVKLSFSCSCENGGIWRIKNFIHRNYKTVREIIV